VVGSSVRTVGASVDATAQHIQMRILTCR
jgi:hypothetical protein